MKMPGGFPSQLVWIFHFLYFIYPSSAKPDIRPTDADTRPTLCYEQNAKTTTQCAHFPPHYGIVLCFYCKSPKDTNLCATRDENFACIRCDTRDIENTYGDDPEFPRLCKELGPPEPEPPVEECKLWQLYAAWSVIAACLVYLGFLFIFCCPCCPGYSCMKRCCGITTKKPEDPERPKPKKRSTKQREKTKRSSVIEIDEEEESTSKVKTNKSSKEARKKSSVKPKKSKKGSDSSKRKKSRKSHSVV